MEMEQPLVSNNTFWQCEQDFWEGAKELNSHSTRVETSPSSFLDEVFDDWAYISEPSDFSDLEVFNQVILPNEELTTDFENTLPPLCHSSSPLSPSQPPTLGFTIKLKRVKCKRKLGAKLGIESVAPLDSLTTEWDRQHTSALSASPFHFSNDFCKTPSVVISNSLTLKEVIDHHDADAILANCLSSQRTFPMATYLDDGGALCDSFVDMRLLQDPSPPMANEDEANYSLLESSSLPSSSLGSPTSSVSSLANDLQTRKASRLRKGRSKIPPDIRYLKKKRQNKEAASRYREKKKRETESIENALHYEDLRRQQLGEDYARMKQEFFLLKKLMRDVAIAKCLVPSEAFE